jgi:hypothetical protein
MPAGIPLALDPGRMRQLQIAAAQGDPQAIQALQGMQGAQPMQGAGPMAGAPPMGGGGPPGGGMPPPGMGQLSPQGGGAPVSPDVAARRAQDLIRILRQRGG